MPLLVVIGGPTAIGKTRISLEISAHFNTEIISADSRQFYKEMNIGTAKPSPDELSRVPHHFVGFLNIWEEYSAGDFERDVLMLLQDLFQKHEVVIMTGGSGLYLDAVCYGFDRMPEVNTEIRQSLNIVYQEQGLKYLQQKLKEVDPDYYKQVDIHNPQRLIRALEVYETTGKPYSHFRKKKTSTRPFDILYIGLDMERTLLYKRINKRVDLMMKEGLLEEVESLKNFQHLNALQTVGYQELFSYFSGDLNLEDAIDLIKRNTRRYAKRQLTWFRRNNNIEWYHVDDIQLIISRISQKLKES